jgi:hypothetical protein
MDRLSNSLCLLYGGSFGIVFLGCVSFVPAVFCVGYGIGAFHYQDGTQSFSVSSLSVGLIFLTISLSGLFLRVRVVFDRQQVSKIYALTFLGKWIALHRNAVGLNGFTVVRLRRHATRNGVTSAITIEGGGREFSVFGTNDRKRMERDATEISSFLGLPLDTSDGIAVTVQRYEKGDRS